ncbi:MAG: ABC transporter ATP-binding protein [Clostridiales bacterium]|nr:ABC transporter ATP-binding protein [Clostridiales bacterium]
MLIDALTIKYNDKTVIDGLSLNIENTEKVALIGVSGVGKTSLVKALLSLVHFDGKITNVPQFSVVFQEDRLVEELSVKKNILLACPTADVEKVLKEVGLKEEKDKKVKTLSGGMKRRVAVARALSSECEMLIADEPFVGLDIATKTRLTSVLKNRLKDKGLFLITHDLLQAYELCDRIIVIDNGKVALDARVEDFGLECAKEWFLSRI